MSTAPTISDNTPCRLQSVEVEYLGGEDNIRIDFCSGDMQEDPVAINTLDLSSVTNNPFGYELVEQDGIWFGFLVNKGNNEIVRLNFEDNPTTLNSVTTLQGLATLSNPEDISITTVNGEWFAIITTADPAPNNFVSLLSFGSDIGNDSPTISTLGNYGISVPIKGASIAYDGTDVFLALTNNRTITIVNFGNSFSSIPKDTITTNTVTNHTMFDLEYYNKCDNWYIVVPTLSRLNIIDLGLHPFNEIPTSNKYLFSSPIISFNAFEIDLITEGDSTYALIMNQSEPYQTFSLKDIEVDIPFLKNNTSNEFITGSSTFFNGGTIFHGINSNSLVVLQHRKNCGESIGSTNMNKSMVSYTETGTHTIVTSEFNINGSENFNYSEINVTTDTAPSISIANQTNCLASPIQFNSDSDGSGLTYNWDFGDGNNSGLEDPMHTYTTAGEYEVTLEIDDGTCGNFIRQTVQVFEEPLPDFNIPGGVICTNQLVSFENITPNISQYDTLISWQWEVDGVLQSTEQELDFEFLSGGNKEVKLIAAIPGCEIEVAKNITNVREGAQPDFTFNDSCQGDLVQFNNSSIGDITSYEWDFGNGFTSTLENPELQFSDAGNFMVSLSLTNADGCITSIEKPISIRSLPLVQFETELACENLLTQFNDLSTVSLDNISSWDWDFGDGATSTDQNPQHLFQTAGNYNVKLITTSTFGCSDSTSQTINVLAAPVANFEFDKRCIGVPVEFTDVSEPVNGEAITSWAWNIGGAFTSDQNPVFTFEDPLDYNVSLTVTSENLCTTTYEEIMTIPPPPTVDFTIDQNCDNELTIFQEDIEIEGDQIASFMWLNGTSSIGSGEEVQTPLVTGEYVVQLDIETENGCNYTTMKNVVVHPAPTASFSPSVTFGAPPLSVDFTNNSSGASEFIWDFQDGNQSSDLNTLNLFENIGEYDVSLVAISSENCRDTVFQRISVLSPELDLELINLSLIPSDMGERVSVTISNSGTVTLDSILVTLDLGGEVIVSEQLKFNLPPNETITEQLQIEIDNRRLDYVCATINSYFDELEGDVSNNSQCLTLNNGEVVFSAPYPNPVAEGRIQLDIIAERSDSATIWLIDSDGRIVSNHIRTLNTGSNQLEFQVDGLKEGLYMVRVEFLGQTKFYRIAIIN